MRKSIRLLGLGLGIVLVAYLLFIPLNYEIDFYWYHVSECVEAHKQGYGISICSGFWHEPIENDDSPCFVNPWENPVEEVGHGSNLGSREIVYGYIQYLQKMREEKNDNNNMLDEWFEHYAFNYAQNQSRQKLLNRCNSWRVNPNIMWLPLLPLLGLLYFSGFLTRGDKDE